MISTPFVRRGRQPVPAPQQRAIVRGERRDLLARRRGGLGRSASSGVRAQAATAAAKANAKANRVTEQSWIRTRRDLAVARTRELHRLHRVAQALRGRVVGGSVPPNGFTRTSIAVPSADSFQSAE